MRRIFRLVLAIEKVSKLKTQKCACAMTQIKRLIQSRKSCQQAPSSSLFQLLLSSSPCPAPRFHAIATPTEEAGLEAGAKKVARPRPPGLPLFLAHHLETDCACPPASHNHFSCGHFHFFSLSLTLTQFIYSAEQETLLLQATDGQRVRESERTRYIGETHEKNLNENVEKAREDSTHSHAITSQSSAVAQEQVQQ